MHIVYECFRVAYKRQEVLTFREHFSSPPVFSGSVLLIFSVFCVVLLCVFAFWGRRAHVIFTLFVFVCV